MSKTPHSGTHDQEVTIGLDSSAEGTFPKHAALMMPARWLHLLSISRERSWSQVRPPPKGYWGVSEPLVAPGKKKSKILKP